MKQILIKTIEIYQRIPINTHQLCKFQPSCSEYAKQAISKYGALKGSYMATKRIIKCNPISKPKIDLVP